MPLISQETPLSIRSHLIRIFHLWQNLEKPSIVILGDSLIYMYRMSSGRFEPWLEFNPVDYRLNRLNHLWNVRSRGNGLFVCLFDWGLTLYSMVFHLYDDGLSTAHCTLPYYGGKPRGNLVKKSSSLYRSHNVWLAHIPDGWQADSLPWTVHRSRISKPLATTKPRPRARGKRNQHWHHWQIVDQTGPKFNTNSQLWLILPLSFKSTRATKTSNSLALYKISIKTTQILYWRLLHI